MTARAIRATLLMSVLSATGCGTAANLVGAGPGKKTPFGGVKHDVRCLTEARDGEVMADAWGGWEPTPHQQRALTVLCATDLPFSLVGDVITWPYTRTYSYINQPTDYPPIQVAAPPLMPTIPFTTVKPASAEGQPLTPP